MFRDIACVRKPDPNTVRITPAAFGKAYEFGLFVFFAALLYFQIQRQVPDAQSWAEAWRGFFLSGAAQVARYRWVSAWPWLLPSAWASACFLIWACRREVCVDRLAGRVVVLRRFFAIPFWRREFALNKFKHFVLSADRGRKRSRLYLEKEPSGRIALAEARDRESLREVLYPLRDLVRLPVLQK